VLVSPVEKTSRFDGGSTALVPEGAMRAYVLVTGLFFLWGAALNLNDVLIRQFMKSFSLSRFEAGLVQSAFFMGYFLLALPAGLLIKKYGYKAGLLTGLSLFACGCFLFIPAAYAGRYAFFLGALFVVASGLAFLETASNPFIAQLGSGVTSERRLNLSQAFNPLGAISGVLVGTIFIFSGIELAPAQVSAMQSAGKYAAYLHGETLRVVMPYLILGIVCVAWAVMIAVTKMPARVQQKEEIASAQGNWRELLSKPHFLFAVIAQFMYVGAQVGTWSYFIQYAQSYAFTTEKTAGYLLTGTLVGFGLGRFASVALMKRISAGALMRMYSLVNIALLLVAIVAHGWAGVIAISLTSFFMSVMFPTIFAMGIRDLGANTNIGGSLIIMSIIGGAIMPPMMGLMHSVALAYQFPLYGYVTVFAYAWWMRNFKALNLSSQMV
jgi:FHS family L-fucose permease-like MFS transporter